MLTKQVAEMKEFINQNDQKGEPEMEESMTYASAKQALSGASSAVELNQVREENEQLVEQIEELRLQYHTIENQLVESKLLSAQLDMECDQLTVQMRQKNENLKKFSAKVTKLEIQLIEAQAQTGAFDQLDTDPENRQRLGGVSPNPKKSTVSDKLKSFLGNKLKIGKSSN